jgi:hypothetical protein
MDKQIARGSNRQGRALLLLIALLPTAAISSSVFRITFERSQVGCETIPEYEQYHSVTYEKTGATPQTAGCHRLAANSVVKPLEQNGNAKIAGVEVPVGLYEVTVGDHAVRLWLSPSAVFAEN